MSATKYEPKHRANKLVRTAPVVQPAGRHTDTIITRLGADALHMVDDLGDMLRDITVGNPFSRANR